MRILVTGGAGAIGCNLVNRLLEDPMIEQVTVLDDLSSGYRENVPDHPKVRFVEGSVTDESALDGLFSSDRLDWVVHLAASFANQTSVENPQKDLHVNGMGTLKLLEYAVKAKVKRLVYSSSSCVYGNQEGILREDTEVFHTETPYAATKLLGERYLKFFHSYHDLDAVILRFFNTYGPGERPGRERNVIPNFLRLAMQKKPLPITGDGTETRDFNYVDDTVTGVMAALKAPPGVGGKVFNLASGRETSILALAEEINRVTRNPAGIVFQNRRKWDTVLRRLASISEAKKYLNYVPRVPVKEGIRRTYVWLVAEDARTLNPVRS